MSKHICPTLLVILDGWGISEKGAGNAIYLANTPNFNKLWNTSYHGYLEASGEAVGLPKSTNGNSEVGHLNIGAGKIVLQELSRIDQAIKDGGFQSNYKLKEGIDHTISFNSNLHIMGLLSNGNVHSSINHLKSLLEFYSKNNYRKQIYLHLFADGRDVAQKSFKEFFDLLNSYIVQMNIGRIESVIGRYYAMDRDKRWQRTQEAYEMLVFGKGKKFNNIYDMCNDYYSKELTDEFFPPTIITDKSERVSISDNDCIVFFNYREDRAIQLTRAFLENDFKEFQRGNMLNNIFFIGMTQYSEQLPINVAFPMESIDYPLGKVISKNNLLQFRVAETEKYAHITYFFNGGREVLFPGEDRQLVHSPKVSNYDLKPEMSSNEITIELVKAIQSEKYSFLLVNFANADMVGHTGDIQAAILAIEAVDYNLGIIFKEIFNKNGNIFITADHGNAETMIHYSSQTIDKEHSTNPVPFIYSNGKNNPKDIGFGILADIAPTILSTMELEIPHSMSGVNLLKSV